MQWNKSQETALNALRGYVSSRRTEPFILSGLAGTGKTTLIAAFLEELNYGNTVSLVAPTGKAASVLNRKQNVAVATTIHSLLYGAPLSRNASLIEAIERCERTIDAHTTGVETHPDIDSVQKELQDHADQMSRVFNGREEITFMMKERELIAPGCRLIVVDEASMVAPEEVANIASLGIPTIYLGDGNQLHPVGHNKFSVPLDHPDAELTEIMRQGAGSPILELSRDIIRCGGLPLTIKDIPVSRGTNPLPLIAHCKNEDVQCIVYKNDTRYHLNAVIRDHFHRDKINKSYAFLPFIGEKLMIDSNRRELGLMKGDIITVTNVAYANSGPVERYIATVTFTDHRGTTKTAPMWMNELMRSIGHPFGMVEPAYGDKEAFQHYKYNFIAKKNSVIAQFPYAITCHKAQGSEWPAVVVFNEGPRHSRQQYLYTAVTRAQEELVIAGVNNAPGLVSG